ncbi:hypothetical protein EVA_18404, partial [gut metagenome]
FFGINSDNGYTLFYGSTIMEKNPGFYHPGCHKIRASLVDRDNYEKSTKKNREKNG